MEYESRQVKWYWLFVYILFCGMAIYLLFSGNPYLYSHVELRSALDSGEIGPYLTIPKRPEAADGKAGTPSYYARFNLQRTAVEPTGNPRSKNYIEFEQHAVETGLENFEVQHAAGDESGFYLTGKSPWALAIGFDGKPRWKYKFIETSVEAQILPALLDQTTTYLVVPQGEVVALDKTSGQIRWLTDVHREVAAQPFLWGKHVIVPVKGQTGVQLVLISRSSGQIEPKSPRLEIKPGFMISHSKSQEAFIATVDNKVIAIDPDDWSVLWSQTLTDPVRGPAVIVDSSVFVATLGAKLLRLDAGKKGKIDWDLDLEKPPRQ
ncbi:MAG: PQQ-binding-like beta-propeller repeat protein, partial [Calothrix sp. SM1_5_4]|nr:PQQ-binding-like beta-propeller repeat protein [Calothrix sp. SM1_5_4]